MAITELRRKQFVQTIDSMDDGIETAKVRIDRIGVLAAQACQDIADLQDLIANLRKQFSEL